jgi:hypothetical protein
LAYPQTEIYFLKAVDEVTTEAAQAAELRASDEEGTLDGLKLSLFLDTAELNREQAIQGEGTLVDVKGHPKVPNQTLLGENQPTHYP